LIDVVAVCRNAIVRRRFRRMPFRSLGSTVAWLLDGAILGPRVTVHTSNPRNRSPACVPYDGGVQLRPVVIAEAVWIGDRAMPCPGVNVGRGAVVAMGSVVSRDVPPFTVVAGNPARVVARRPDPDALDRMIREGTFYLRLKREGRIRHVESGPEPEREALCAES
jgi:hypothetical protein